MLRAMATQPLDTAKVYALTAAGACSVTLMQDEKSITWEALAEGGQTSFVVPAGATVSISDETALLSPLPANFKAALGADAAGAGGFSISAKGEKALPVEETAPTLPMKHARWYTLHAETSSCSIAAADTADMVVQTHLIITPAINMPADWLQAAPGTVVRWPFGEIAMTAGWSYIITLVQIGNVILANALPVDLSNPAA